ncbi:MAG: hypothetical protein MI922_27265, partial [Bacteroidales bacterium]|nr:hypothetical protein [Bacteroidales bacterium]
KKILMQHCSDNSEFDDDIDISWNLCINDEHLALLCRNKTYFNFYKDILPVKTNRDEVYDTVDALIQTDLDNRYAKTSDDIAIEKGDYPQGIGDYSTMQSNFPLTYGVGPKGIPGPNTTERKAQAKQLKGYLLFFDQILANYFSQLDNVKHLLAADDSIKKTYFSQTVKNLSGIDELVKNYVDYEDIVELSTSKIDNYIERKNKFLDHLIARFAESFNDYVLLMHSEFSEHSEDEIIHDKVAFIREYAPISAARGKAMNLLDINNGIWDTTNVSGFQRRVSRLCGINNYVRRDLSGVNYAMYLEKDTDPVDEYRFRIYDTDGKKIILSSSTKYTSENEAIEELRKAIKLGLSFSSYKILQSKDERYYFNIVDDTDEVIARRIEYFETRELCEQAAWYLIDYLNLKFSDEGMYVIEHPMLLPQEGATEPFVTVCTDPNCAHCDPLDPYSFRISVILPGWTERFENIDFRKFVEKTIRMETPAHILARICWIGKDQMTEFEELYQYYLTAKFKEKVNDASIPTTLHQSFLDKLQELYTIYHEGHLHDCSDDNLDNTIILGGSTLGTIDNEEE